MTAPRWGVLWEVASTEARRRMAYRVDFWIHGAFGVLVHFAVFWYLWTSLFATRADPRLGGLDLAGVVLYYAAVLLVARLVRGPDFDSGVATEIYEGALNRYLILPVPYAAFKYAQHLGSLLPVLVQVLVLAGLAALVLPASAGVHLTGAGLLRALPALWLAHLLWFLMGFAIQCVAFWAENVWSLLVALRVTTDFLGGIFLPLALLPLWAREAGGWLPFHCLFSLPVRTLLGQVDPGEWARGLFVGGAWALLLGALCAGVWRRGTRGYTGVGM